MTADTKTSRSVNSPAPEDEDLERFGYRQQFVRSLRHFESFAVALSFISITTGIFTTYALALATGGTQARWAWDWCSTWCS